MVVTVKHSEITENNSENNIKMHDSETHACYFVQGRYVINQCKYKDADCCLGQI